MHYCLRCHYALGPLPGVPADQLGEFTADVRCPECAFEIPQGARILVGSSTEAGAQPLTNRRRMRQILVTLAPSVFFLVAGIQGLVALVAQGVAGFTGWNAMRALSLVLFGFLIWAVWRKWTPVEGSNGRAPASWDTRWLCVPGALEVFSGETTDPDARSIRGGAKVGASTDGAKAKVSWLQSHLSGHVRHEAADVRNIRVYSPQDPWNRWRSGDRAVAQLMASVWLRDATGRRADMHTVMIYLDTKGEPGQPGRDRTRAVLDAGDAIARSIRRTIGMAETESDDGAAVAGATDGHAGVPPLAVEGSLYAQRASPAPKMEIIRLFCIPLTFSFVGAMACALPAVTRWQSGRPAVAPWLIWFGAMSLVVFAIMLALTIWLIRRTHRRELALCRWDVGTHGIRVTERHCTIKAKPTAEFTRDIPAGHIAAIGPSPKNGRMRLIASDQVRRELASITLNAIPEGGAEALAQRIRERIWGGDAGKPGDERGA
ncbi:MAG: hypothetical protein EXS04_07315 [Phycisphaerales bacterium]|nr:hypothetical protein [Phycisphaerales bacterium]